MKCSGAPTFTQTPHKIELPMAQKFLLLLGSFQLTLQSLLGFNFFLRQFCLF
jgi:hypothetical protein